MKKHSLVAGGRKWFGIDFAELGGEALDAVEALVADYPPCILSGCVVDLDGADMMTVTAGFALMKEASGAAHIVRVPPSGPLHIDGHPKFLTLVSTPASRLYDDNISREISRDWKAQWAATQQTAQDIQFVVDTGGGVCALVPVPNLRDEIGAAALESETPYSYTLSSGTAMTVYVRRNLLTRTVYVRGTLSVPNAQAISTVYNQSFPIILPAELVPAGDHYFPIMRRVHGVTPAQALELSLPIMGGYRGGSFCASPTKPADSSITSYTGYFNTSWPLP